MSEEEEHILDENMDSDTEEASSSSSSSTSSLSSSENEEEPTYKKITLKARKDKRSRGKWKLLSDKKVFKKEWLDLYPWVDEDPKNEKLAFCKICNIAIKAISRGNLETHQKSKRHIRKLAGPEYFDEPKKEERPDFKQPGIGIDQITDEQISYFAESQADAAHNAVTTLIDKLVEKYHENRLANVKIQTEAMFNLNAERAKIKRTVNQKKLERRLQQEAYERELQEAQLKFVIDEHETRIRAMEGERDSKLRAVEQELVFAKQEYEKKVRLLDSQLSSMK